MAFEAGDGTALDPYLIATAAQFDDIRNFMGAHFALVGDIDLSEGGIDNWAPMSGFHGTIDGRGHRILNFNCVTTGAAGLVSSVGVGTTSIKRLAIIGGALGVKKPSTLYGAYFIGTMQTAGAVVSLEDVYAAGTMDHGGDRYGGIVGIAETGSLTVHRAVCNVARLSTAGTRQGPICYNFGSIATVSNSYYNSSRWSSGSPGTARTVEQMSVAGNFVGLTLGTEWEMSGGAPLPKRIYDGAITGTVTDDIGNPAARVVRAYNRTTGRLTGSVTSDEVTGTYSIPAMRFCEYTVNAIAEGDQLPDLVLRRAPA